MKKIADNPLLESRNGAIINNDVKGYQAYVNQRRLALQQKAERDETHNKMQTLEAELNEMRNMIAKLLQNK